MSSTKRRKSSRGRKLARWTNPEVEYLSARFDQPFKTVYRGYTVAGFERSERAVSVKFYALKKGAGKTVPRGGSPIGGVSAGEDTHPALALAAQHDTVTLQAAVEIRRVLEGLD